jgi:hypothetical protein
VLATKSFERGQFFPSGKRVTSSEKPPVCANGENLEFRMDGGERGDGESWMMASASSCHSAIAPDSHLAIRAVNTVVTHTGKILFIATGKKDPRT